MRVSPRMRKWLTGPQSDPSVRARFWMEVEGRSPKDAPVRRALREIGKTGWAGALLANQFNDGHWVTPGSSAGELYRPKYIATNWHAIVLGDLGMTRADPRIRRTAELILNRWSEKGGDLDGHSGEICVAGNAARTLIRFGYLDHPAVQATISWISTSQKADGGWHCWPSRTGTLDGWEGLAALAEIPEAKRDASVQTAIKKGAEFYLSRHLMDEGKVRYPPWFRIHYPNHYYYDLLQGLRIMARLGFAKDPRLARALRWLESKRRSDGTWALDAAHPDIDPALKSYGFHGPCFPMELEGLGRPSRWATVEALSVLARVEGH